MSTDPLQHVSTRKLADEIFNPLVNTADLWWNGITQALPRYAKPITKRDTVAVVVPAYNEAAQIQSTIESLRRQTRRIDRIVVVANNCTDNTAELARAAGVDVVEMDYNPYKKAGALNAGVEYLRKEGSFPEFIVTIDGDTDLDRHCVKRAYNVMHADPGIGGLSVVCVGKKGIGSTPGQRLLTWMQRVEYARAGYIRLRKDVHTLSGAGTFLRGIAVLQIIEDRGVLFAEREDNIVEDFELTLELKKHGWKCVNNFYCIANTDLMPTVPDLLKQRYRWVRGTVDELRRRGWCRETRASILAMYYGVFSLPLYYAWPVLFIYNALHNDIKPQDFWFLPLISLYQALAARRLGWLSMLAVSTLVFDFLFGMLRHWWFIKSIVMSYRGKIQKMDWKVDEAGA